MSKTIRSGWCALALVATGGCEAVDLAALGFMPEAAASEPTMAVEPWPASASTVVTGESGLAAGIPAAVQSFPDPATDPSFSASDRLPTLLPRQLPEADRNGTDFADQVSIAPDGRRLIIGSQNGKRFDVTVVGVNSKATEGRLVRRGQFAFVGWTSPQRAVLGYRHHGQLRIEAFDLSTGQARLVSTERDGGILTIAGDGRIVPVTADRRRFICADSVAVPTAYEGLPIVQAGPLDERQRIVFRTTADAERGVLVPFDCGRAAFDAPLYEGSPFEGALYDTAGRRYLGIWNDAGPRYFDRSLAYELAEVEASFDGDVDVYPIEFTASPNTVLLYVTGDDMAGRYYVLDRYAGKLDLHVDYGRP